MKLTKVKSRYNVFTKAELVEFLDKNEHCNRYGYTPFDIMIEPKMENVLKQIEAIKFKEEKVAQSQDDEQIIRGLAKLRANYGRWVRLNKEYDKLSKLRFGD